MKEFTKGALTVFVGAMMLVALFLTRVPDVMAVDCGTTGVETAVLGENGCYEVNDNGGGIVQLVRDIADIMTAGVGVLGVIGITWAGIQYLTAGGSEEKTRVAKRRIYEIVIGLVAYVLIYVILRWLLPGFGS